jgi:hypothetical protein
MGYNDLLLIPSGATNIRITEVRHKCLSEKERQKEKKN